MIAVRAPTVNRLFGGWERRFTALEGFCRCDSQFGPLDSQLGSHLLAGKRLKWRDLFGDRHSHGTFPCFQAFTYHHTTPPLDRGHGSGPAWTLEVVHHCPITGSRRLAFSIPNGECLGQPGQAPFISLHALILLSPPYLFLY